MIIEGGIKLVAEAALRIQLEDLAWSLRIHPTLSESLGKPDVRCLVRPCACRSSETPITGFSSPCRTYAIIKWSDEMPTVGNIRQARWTLHS